LVQVASIVLQQPVEMVGTLLSMNLLSRLAAAAAELQLATLM
jgi:hypothetical protein